MAKSLVIVESPAKAKTINKYLGSDYVVEASIGHIMDLPKNDIGVEIANRTFEPTLIVSPGKEKVVDRLKKLAAKADWVYLAPDPDREGGDCRASLDAAEADDERQVEAAARDLQRDYAEGGEGRVRALARCGRESGGRAADAQSFGSAGGVSDLAAALGQGPARVERRARADGGAAFDCGARERDQCIQAG